LDEEWMWRKVDKMRVGDDFVRVLGALMEDLIVIKGFLGFFKEK
jgi:hypothetical protein